MDRVRRRIGYLDGLRGVAISTVFAYHLYSSGPSDLTPYHARYASIPVAEYGWMGVELFFLISGFVIFMTIERCSGLFDFLVRRWLRLFPAMLLVTAILFTITRTLHLPGRYSSPNPIDVVPGLTFVSPAILHLFIRVPITSLDDTFWSLYVEVAFYLIFGLMYFAWGWRRAVTGLILIAIVQFAATRAAALVAWNPRLLEPMQWLGLQYFAWFASGALFYKACDAGNARLRLLAILVGILAAATLVMPFMTLTKHLILIGIVLVFAAAQVSPYLQWILASRAFVFVGYVSYPLYLLHSNLAVGLTVVAARRGVPPLVASWIAIAIVVTMAFVLTRWAEPWLRNRLRAGATTLLGALGRDRLPRRLDPPERVPGTGS